MSKPRAVRLRPKPVADPQELAEKLAVSLHISNGAKLKNSRPNAKPNTRESQSLAAMRAINKALHLLASAAGAGYKASAPRTTPGISVSSVTSNARAAATALRSLRTLNSSDLDVEKAASSLSAKLIELEMLDDARSILSESRSSLIQLYAPDVPPSTGLVYNATSLPLPLSPITTPVLLLLSNYLLQSLQAHTSHPALSESLSTTPTLLIWIEHMTELSSSHKDALLTRAYSALTRSSSSPSSNVLSYALRCLACTTPGTIAPSVFWKHASALADPTQVVETASTRPDVASFFSGSHFIAFCENWASSAKQSGDLTKLERIAELLRQITASSTGKLSDEDTLAITAAHICVSLARLTTGFELANSVNYEGAGKQLINVNIVLTSIPVALLRVPNERASSKVYRALERFRRAVIALLESGRSNEHSAALGTLESLVDVYSQVPDIPSALTSALDALFVIARRVSTDQAHSYLARAISLTKCDNASPPPTSSADQIRCIAGAYHNLGATQYTVGQYGCAVSFLREACRIGEIALAVHIPSEKVENIDPWIQLKEQLFRRWEVLGVCLLKAGDRTGAHDAFLKAIRSFPYESSNASRHARSLPLSQIFITSPLLTQLGGLIERYTILSACELLQSPQTFAFSHVCRELNPSVVGLLLERQERVLAGRPEGVASRARLFILNDAMKTYAEMKMPIRHARVMARTLEAAFQDPKVGMNDAVEGGLTVLNTTDLGEDIELAHFYQEYSGLTRLWRACHIHRTASSTQTAEVEQEVKEAIKLFRQTLDGSLLPDSTRTKTSTKKTVPTKNRKPTSGKKAISTAEDRAPEPPVTPKRPPLITALSNVRSPQKVDDHTPFDDFDSVLNLLQVTTRLLSLLGLYAVKVQLLDLTMRLCSRFEGRQRNGYIAAVADLAHEYAVLGKSKRAGWLFSQALLSVRSGEATEGIRVRFMLKYSEALADSEDVARSAEAFCEARRIGVDDATPEDKTLPSVQRVRARVERLEAAALASYVCGVIQFAKEDLSSCLEGLLQSLRLWNRACEALARLHPTPKPPPGDVDNPFVDQVTKLDSKANIHRPGSETLGWRVSEGLFYTLLALSRVYFTRGAPREAAFFAEQAAGLGEGLRTPAAEGRALAKLGEVELHQGKLTEGLANIERAAELLTTMGTDAVEIKSLRGDFSVRSTMRDDAQILYQEACSMLDELEGMFGFQDVLRRKSVGLSPSVGSVKEILVPGLLASVLREQIWLLRDDRGESSRFLLRRFLSLPPSAQTKVQETALMARLALHDARSRFRSDMFLSSLAESTISIPMGMKRLNVSALTQSTQEILSVLNDAEKLFWADLKLVGQRGRVAHVRDAAISLALIIAFQTSLGTATKANSVLAAGLLDFSAGITLRREIIDSIKQKLSTSITDDTQWPTLSPNGTAPNQVPPRRGLTLSPQMDDTSDNESPSFDSAMSHFWLKLQARYGQLLPNAAHLERVSSDLTKQLPRNWVVITVSLMDDKGSMFVSRRRRDAEALIFCVPLKGRREANGVSSGDDDEGQHLAFEGAQLELNEIISLSADGAKRAIHVKKDDPVARAAWWAERTALDGRMKALLENIEFCWLGAFKTIFSRRTNAPASLLDYLRIQIENLVHHSLQPSTQNPPTKPLKSHSPRKAKGNHSSSSISRSPVRLEDELLRMISTLSPKCAQEELEDLIYFLLDLYQLCGVPVAISEVDVDQLAVDLRGILEEFTNQAKDVEEKNSALGYGSSAKDDDDEHVFLVLDKNVQGIPWESIPVLRGRSVSRIPSLDFLIDRLNLARIWKGESDGRRAAESESKASTTDDGGVSTVIDRIVVDPRKTFYILNPSGDLAKTEGRFSPWLKSMREVGWDGVIGKPPTEQQVLKEMERRDLVMYFGHGGAEQYVRSHKIRALPRCAATLLWGCSSGFLQEMGDFDRVGTPFNYMLAGCPTLVANLWDVTDRDIDLFTQNVFDQLKLTPSSCRNWTTETAGKTSVVAAVARARGSCKLKYLTGAAPVVYGIPFYL